MPAQPDHGWFRFGLQRLTIAVGLAPALGATVFAANSVTVYPPVGYELSREFEVAVNDEPVRVDEILQEHVAYFEFTGRVDVVIRTRAPISAYRISPVSWGINSEVKVVRRRGLEQTDRELRFSLDQPRRLVVSIDNLPRLLIWAEGAEDNPPRLGDAGVINVIDFGAPRRTFDPAAGQPSYGPAPATDVIRQAIDAVPPGGVLYFPPGLYVSGTICLKSNMTMYLAAGARIIGSPLRDDYPKARDLPEADTVTHPTLYFSKGRNLSYRQLLLVDGAENVTIRGRGMIDGNGEILRPQGFFIYILKVIDGRNVRIEDIVINNSAAWGPHYLHSTGIIQRNTKQITNFGVKSSGGPHPDASRDVLIEDNFAICRDDFVAVKVTGNAGLAADAENIVVRRNVAISGASALKIGTEVNDGCAVRNVLFADNDVIACDRGMAIYLEDGGLAENIRFEKNRFEHMMIEGNRRLIDFYIIERPDQIQQHGTLLEHSKGRVRHVLIKDCVALVPWPMPSTMVGLDADHRISDVRIENLVIAGRPVLRAADIPLETGVFVEGLQVTGLELPQGRTN